jgi:hypothetical protein
MSRKRASHLHPVTYRQLLKFLALCYSSLNAPP